MLLLTPLASTELVRAQEGQPSQEQTREAKQATRLEPPPLLRWEDYQGPFKELAGTLDRKIERKSAQPPHYKPGVVSFLSAGFNAGLDQAATQDPTFGQGAAGYGKRFGADFAGQTASRFFGDFAYPTIFSEDPRYYRLGHDSARSRILHAAEHTLVSHRDNGKHMFNFTEWIPFRGIAR
ncbi:MAG: hypothetical protein ABSB35_03660 [Bryobacteraceae bacterium]|jgi:hypothetical protein